MKKTCLADIWGDTVDLYDLGKGIVIGIIINFISNFQLSA